MFLISSRTSRGFPCHDGHHFGKQLQREQQQNVLLWQAVLSPLLSCHPFGLNRSVLLTAVVFTTSTHPHARHGPYHTSEEYSHDVRNRTYIKKAPLRELWCGTPGVTQNHIPKVHVLLPHTHHTPPRFVVHEGCTRRQSLPSDKLTVVDICQTFPRVLDCACVCGVCCPQLCNPHCLALPVLRTAAAVAAAAETMNMGAMLLAMQQSCYNTAVSAVCVVLLLVGVWQT